MKAVILDLDGVYFHSGTENFIQYLKKKYALDEEQIKAVYLRSDMMQQYKKGNISGEEFWFYAITTWNIKATKEELLYALQDGYELNGKKKEIMKLLLDHKIHKIVCSNNFAERIQILNERFGFLQEFDFIVLSYEHHTLKPQLLDLVEDITHIQNNDIAYFDDKKENIDHANSIGMQGILINEPSRVLKMLKELLL
jgi:FMN phosphatase YigB (HAD superfamily)